MLWKPALYQGYFSLNENGLVVKTMATLNGSWYTEADDRLDSQRYEYILFKKSDSTYFKQTQQINMGQTGQGPIRATEIFHGMILNIV